MKLQPKYVTYNEKYSTNSWNCDWNDFQLWTQDWYHVKELHLIIKQHVTIQRLAQECMNRNCLKVVNHNKLTSVILLEFIMLRQTCIECVHMTSRRPCWSSKQRNVGHVGGVKYSFGDWTLFLCKFLLLFHYANMASGHMSEHTLVVVALYLEWHVLSIRHWNLPWMG